MNMADRPGKRPDFKVPALKRDLSLMPAVMVVIGSVIGSGIFLTPQNVAAAVQVPGVMIAVWILTGLLTLAGALTNAEIASLFREAGGQYVFFRVSFKDLTAFLYGWTTFTVYQTGTIAAIAMAFAKYTGYFIALPHLSVALEAVKLPFIGNIHPLRDFGVTLVAMGAIVAMAAINYIGVKFSSAVLTVFTVAKMAAIGGIVLVAFCFGKGNPSHFLPLWGMPTAGNFTGAFGVAMIAALWSYDGWNVLTYLGGEIKEPQKNIPRALFLGTAAVIVIYVLTNLAYLYILPIREMASSKLVAADVMGRVFPGLGGAIISAVVMLSTIGAVNANSMATARVFYAMAKDGLFFRSLGKVHPKYHTPAGSLIVQTVWACFLTLTGTFDQLFTYVIFAGWIFYLLGAVAVFIFRKKVPDLPRPYKVPGYPVVPVLFVIVATWFVANTILEQTADSMVGLILVLSGIPFYLYWKAQNKKANRRPFSGTEALSR
jgi:APA family basic amino acid/polyamine antiporter